MYRLRASDSRQHAPADTLVRRLRDQAQRNPSRTAIRFLSDGDAEALSLDYAEVDRRARLIGARLDAAGAAGERALILHAPGPEYVASLLGCLYAGVIAVPAYPPTPRTMARLEGIAADSRARFALGQPTARTAIDAQHGRAPALAALRWLAGANGEGEPWDPPDPDPSATALLQYTSGSTSAPKGVQLTHANFLDNIDALNRLRGQGADDRFMCWLPPFHDMGLVFGILAPLSTGVESTLLAPAAFMQRPYRWLAAISEFGATISGGPDFAYELCVRRVVDRELIERLDLSRWRVAFCGAERVRPETLERFAAAFAPARFRRSALTACYGLAESTVAVAFAPIDAAPRVLAVDARALGSGRVEAPASGASAQALTSCGRALAGCELLIVDPERRRPVGAGQVGEIWLRGPSVGAGYWDKPELSEQVFRARLAGDAQDAAARYLRTGDLGFQRDDDLFVVGRIKDLIILRGVNHYPEDIEITAQASHARLRAGGGAAFAVDADGEEQIVLVQEVDSIADVPLAQIAAAAAGAIAQAHEVTVRLVLAPPGAVPRTSSGKVQRGACRRMYLEGTLKALAPSAPSVAAPAPAALVERTARLMAGLLGVPALGPEDDFFWLGGHSLLATQLVSRIEAEFAVGLSLRAVFDARTPARVAALIAAAPRRDPLPPIVPVERTTPRLPLSYSQERMWLLNRLDPRSAAYNVAGALAIDGPLDVEALGRAFNEVLARHEVLRSTYPEVDGEPCVRIAPRASLALAPIDVSSRPDPQAAALAAASALARAPFDVGADPLLRAALYRLGPDRHLACVCLHHLVTDAWSLGLLVEDLLRCYEALAAGAAPAPLDRRLEYVDYAHWQRTYLGGDRLAGQLAYWKEQLAGAVPVELPGDRPRSRHRSAAGALEPLALPNDLMDALSALGGRHGTTLFMVLLAAFEALLFRHTGSGDLVVGIPVANRNRLDAEPLMGSLVNTLALRLRFDGELPFTGLLAQVREAALDAYANQDLPFERLVAELPVERRPGESPIVSVMFDYQNTPFPGRRAGGLSVRPVVLERGAAQFDLSLLVFDTELGRTAGIEYSTERFDAATARRLLGHYRSILDAIVADPGLPVARLPLLGRDERAQLLALAAPAHRDPAPAPLVEAAFAAQARRAPRAPAVVDDEGVLDYARLDRESSALAAALSARGARPGERVAVYLERDRRLVVSMLAVLKSGAAYVPLDPRHPAERIAYMLADAAPRVVLTRAYLRAKLAPQMMECCLCVDEAALAAAPAQVPAPDVDGERTAYLIYTSGSTGRPKGVEVPAAALANFLRSMRREPGIAPDDRVLAVTTVAFDIAGLEIWLPLVAGASLRLVSSDAAADGPALLAILRNWRPTLMQATPATWKLLLESGWEGDPNLKALCGGEAFPPELARALRARCRSVWNMYGPTETTIWSTVRCTREEDTTRVPIGRPVDDTRVYILDGHGELQPLGVAGEIFIGGAGVAKGYFGRPELTRERFVADPFAAPPGARMYRTGDGGRLRADGVLECLARLDDQIKLRGFRIEPGEIEAVLKEDPRVRDAVVIVREDRAGDQRLVAYYVPARAVAPEPLPLADVLEPLQRRLPAYMVPSAIVALPALPKTPNGKIDRARLPAPQASDGASDDGYVAPRDELEAGLAGIWEEVLGTAPVGVRDSFFGLGGHSLLAVRMFARVEKRFGAALPLASLIERPTIEYLAERIRERRRVPRPPAPPSGVPAAGAPRFEHLVPIERRGTRAPLFCVHGAGGHVLNFERLSSRLGADRPLYGFQARGIDGRTAPHASVEQMAEAYLAELRLAQPRGPYFLAGYCGGGVIAYEMARRLREAGQRVALLALLDCYRPGIVLREPRHLRWTSGVLREGTAYVRRKAVARLWRDLRTAVFRLRVAACRLLRRPLPYELRDAWMTRAFLDAARHYRPAGYAGTLTVLRATEVDPELLDVGPELGWSGYVAGGVQSFEVPGDHHSLLHEPNIGALAATLGECLRAAEARAAP